MSVSKLMVSEQRMESFWASARMRMDMNCREIDWETGPSDLANKSTAARKAPAAVTRKV